MKTLFIPVKDKRPVKQLMPKLLSKLKGFKNISVTSTVQFSHRIKEVKSYLLTKGFKARTCSPVLGCKAIIPKTDCTVIISSGEFHAINIGLITDKPVFILDPLMNRVLQLDQAIVNRYRKKQAVRISKVLSAKTIGILISKKSGQHKPLLARKIKKLLESKGYKPILFVGDELSPLQLNDFPVDVWINTACPRIVEDDFDKSIVNWAEIKNYI